MTAASASLIAEFQPVNLDATKAYDEARPLYDRGGVRLAFAVERDCEVSPLYLVLHEGRGQPAKCVRRWTPEQLAHADEGSIANEALAVVRMLEVQIY